MFTVYYGERTQSKVSKGTSTLECSPGQYQTLNVHGLLPVEPGCATVLALMCNNLHEVLQTRETLVSRGFTGAPTRRHDWLIVQVVVLSRQVDRYPMTWSPALNHTMALSVACPHCKSHCYSRPQANGDYLLGAKGKGQTSLGLDFLLYR